MSTSSDRERAARLLMRVEQGAFASRLLGRISEAGVRTRVLGVLRWLRPLDAAIGEITARKGSSLDPEIRAALRIGLFEIEVLGVPPAVAGDGAVHLARRLGGGRASGLVNAVIRRAPREWSRFMAEGSPAVRASHPEWLWRRWAKVFGEERARAAMDSAQQPAPLWVWFTDRREDQELRDRKGGPKPHPWMPDAWRSEGGDLIRTVAAGRAYAQDPASQLVALTAVRLSGKGARMVDLCAAPGGKAARAIRDGAFAQVVAADLSLTRLGLADRLFDRVGGDIYRVVQNAKIPALVPNSWDVVLLDSPCSGTGTLRRHPELRWRLKPDDIGERAVLQRQLLEGALDLVSPGGVLLYSTCSVELEENEAHFLEIPEGFEIEDLMPLLPSGVDALTTSRGGYRLLPQDCCDGFTVHALRRQLRQ